MSKVFMSKRKTATAVIAVVMTVLIIFGGTFAWQSIQQEALNEVSATVNPGGRLHDDFNDITDEIDPITNEPYKTMTFDKNVYVENFTSYASNGVHVFARIRLDEYMELGKDAGVAGNTTAKSVVDGATLDNKDSWTPHIPNNTKDPFHEYWNWDISDGNDTNEGKVPYMPTFNKNKDSLEADINGTFDAQFTDYTPYKVGDEADLTAIYDADTPDASGVDIDELVRDNIDTDAIINGEELHPNYSQHVTLKDEKHVAKETLEAYVITMADYIALLNDNNPNNDTGNFWVWDTDGWAYWASPISPETATGVLLDGINRTETVINEDWYYAINVVAQFITKDDIGYENRTGFYADGQTVSSDALLLLNEIGVDVTFEVDSAAELTEALAHGGNVILNSDVKIDTNLVVSADTTLNLNGHTISNENDIWKADEKVWSLISVRGADTTLTINGGTFTALNDDCFAVDVRDGARVVINDGTFVGNISAVYVYEGTALINGGNFSIQQQADGVTDPYNQMINAYNDNRKDGKATITICGGKFVGFDPTHADDGNLVAANYTVTESVDDNGAVVYTVSKTVTE